MNYKVINLINKPEMKEQAAQWFHEKWGIPLGAYTESMEACLAKRESIPQWYVAIENDRIIGGLGVIENDFHDRKDLTPNVCAVYTEVDRRCNGVAETLLNYVCADMKKKGLTLCTLSQTIHLFMSAMVGNFFVWYREMEKQI